MTATARKSGSHPRAEVAPPTAAPRPPTDLGVVDQVRAALKPKARPAAVAGVLLGGVVPVSAFWLSHHELPDLERVGALAWPDALRAAGALLAVLGCLVFSAKSVFQWARLAFGEVPKALGFVVLLEVVMTTSRTEWLSAKALVYLVAINAVATGCNLSQGRKCSS